MTDERAENLENLLSPFCFEQETPLPKTIPEVPGGIYLSGFISQDCTWGCSYNQSVIKCFPVEKYFEDNHTLSHSCNASLAVSSSSYKFTSGRIACATELAIHNQRVCSGTRKLLLGISYSTNENDKKALRGALVIFDPVRCAPMKWIEMPEPVSSVTVLSHFEEGGSNRPFFNETMMAMVGIAAVGLRGGSVIIVDLGLDDPFLLSGQTIDELSIPKLSYQLIYMTPHEYVIATKRHKAVSSRKLISLKFSNESEMEMVPDAFHYCKPNGEVIQILHKNSVAVTCIEYVPAIGSLLVGFTCGAFQIWRVNSMELQFSSEPVRSDRDVPVFGFSFQQPVDDPKNYCYVWVMYGTSSAECTSTHVELYSLLYEDKDYIENFGYAYDDFRQCAKRLAFPLVDDFLSNDSEAGEDSSIRASARPIRIWSQPDSDLMLCAWEVGRGGIFYLGAFDLNQWYSNHTREQILYSPKNGLCPFWVAIPVEVPDISNVMLDVRIIPKSLVRWENPHSKLEVHLYPASCSFRAVCLTNTGVSAFEHFGVQEKLVRIMLKDGESLMIQPASLKESFTRYGLEPVYSHVYGEHLSQKDRDRFFIFSVMLESRRTSALIRLGSIWLDGSYANVGCTLDLIIDWIGSYMVAVRSVADEHWENLFGFEDDALPPETIRFINFSNFAWTSLHKMLRTLMNPLEVYSARGQELEEMEYGLRKLTQYSAALLMLYKAKLLPKGDKRFFRSIIEFYDQRREEAKAALDASPYIDKEYKKSHPLMVDYLMDALLAQEDIRAEWHVEDGKPLYPPEHVGYLVNMFMLPNADPKTIARIFMYFFIDLNSIFAEYASNSSCEIIRKVRGDFKAVMDCAEDEYQDILALWSLDHGFHEEILVQLKERDRLFESDGLPWCAATVALTAAGFESDVAELLLRSCPHSLARLLFSLMTSSLSKYNSLAELMISSNLSANDALLQEFFEVSENRACLDEFIRYKSKELPEGVRIALLNFLNASNSSSRLKYLLMFYVHTEDYQKLEKEFTRVRAFLNGMDLSDEEQRSWKLLECHIVHLLTKRRTGAVGSFLRFQSPQSVYQKKCTMTIKAIPAGNYEATTKESCDSFREHPKLPPQLKKLKLNETMTQDPLSPLRRYAGRIQTAVTSGENSEKELQTRRLSDSRKSFSRRFSFSTNRQSIGNKTLMNESLDAGYNVTLKNTSFDLMSLLKTPSVDHRVPSRSSVGFNNTLNNTAAQLIPEASTSLPHPVHSIMKEKDPTKPKVAKKVELNLERLSLNSSEGEDERNMTVYEDAEDSNLEDVRGAGNAEGGDTSAVDTDFDASFKSVLESESVEEESPNRPENFDMEEMKAGTSSQNENLLSDKLPDIKGTPSKLLLESECQSEVHQDEGMDRTVYGLPVIQEMDESSREESANVCLESAADQSLFLATIVQKDEDEKEDEVFVSPEPPSKSTPSPLSSPKKDNLGGSQTLEKTDSHTTPPKTSQDEEKGEESIGMRTRSSTSRTPTKEAVKDNQSEASVSPTSSQRRLRSSRSRTPTRESTDESKIGVDISAQRQTRKSKSRTSSCDASTGEMEVSSDERQLRRSSRTRTPPREVETHEEPELKRLRPLAGRNSRGTTPTRELPSEGIKEESEGTLTRRRTRSSRSTTPTREIIIEESTIKELIESKPLRRTRRTSSRSTTPTREINVEESPEKGETSRTVRRSTRTSAIREIFEDEVEEGFTSSILTARKTRATRSRTPTREKVEQQDQEEVTDEPEKIATRRTLRATRSTTPTRDTAAKSEDSDNTSEKPSRKRSRVLRSKTPTRELEEGSEDSETKSRRRGSRASKTPTREVFKVEDSGDQADLDTTLTTTNVNLTESGISPKEKSEAEEATQSQSSFIFDTTENEEVEERETVREEVKAGPFKSRKKNAAAPVGGGKKRKLRYFAHSPELSTLIEDSRTEITTEPSLLDATTLPVKADSPKKSKIKGIRARAPSEEIDVGDEPAKPSKRRRPAVIPVDIDDDDDDDDDDYEVKSQVSTRSNRSASSKRSTASSKGKRGRRGRSAK